MNLNITKVSKIGGDGDAAAVIVQKGLFSPSPTCLVESSISLSLSWL